MKKVLFPLVVILFLIFGLNSFAVNEEGQEVETNSADESKNVSEEQFVKDSLNALVINSEDFRDYAIIRALNKITTRITKLKIKSDDIVKFGNLDIKVHKCWQAPPELEPENKVLMEIWEQVPGEEKEKIFSGWMFSSSPALSALEHPVYDVTLIECTNNE